MQIKHPLPILNMPRRNSHKGQNGKLLIIGGSDLFHAASQWSFNVASKIVDMVFYCSTPENNEIMHSLKTTLTDGLVISRTHVLDYMLEADVILIGPGMTRNEFPAITRDFSSVTNLSEQEWNSDTYSIVNFLLTKFPQKKFVLDAGALQMLEIDNLNANHLLTPHHGEYAILQTRVNKQNALQWALPTILETGVVDIISRNGEIIEEIIGGNEGMTKGGTGDALAGLAAALYCFNDITTSAIWASYVCKSAGDDLYQKVGPFFNTSDLATQIPPTLWNLLLENNSNQQ